MYQKVDVYYKETLCLETFYSSIKNQSRWYFKQTDMKFH